eukprot:491243-Pelagomonas_calceolata.AAC.8
MAFNKIKRPDNPSKHELKAHGALSKAYLRNCFARSTRSIHPHFDTGSTALPMRLKLGRTSATQCSQQCSQPENHSQQHPTALLWHFPTVRCRSPSPGYTSCAAACTPLSTPQPAVQSTRNTRWPSPTSRRSRLPGCSLCGRAWCVGIGASGPTSSWACATCAASQIPTAH